MLDGISSALSGLSAAVHRLEISASNVANASSDGSIPASDAAERRDAYQPRRVEQSSTADGGTATSDRLVRPSYIPVFDTGSPFADSSGQVAAPNVDIAEEFTEEIGARQSIEANLKSIKSMSDLVKKLYDLPE
jgi:flagellar basal-body rod protein FlgC